MMPTTMHMDALDLFRHGLISRGHAWSMLMDTTYTSSAIQVTDMLDHIEHQRILNEAKKSTFFFESEDKII